MAACGMCGKTTTDLVGWKIVGIQFLSMNPTIPTPPGGRTLEQELPDLHFDSDECLQAWKTRVGI